MEQYSVPQFIERESRIALFLSWKQFIYLIIGGAASFILYKIIPFTFFKIIAVAVVGGAALAFAFIRINNAPLPVILWQSLGFLTGTKSYTWKKKEAPYPFSVVKKAEIKRPEEKPVLKIAGKSGLKKLSTKIELKSR